MQPSPEQQKAIEQQKAQCIFCQIIDEKIPSKKVYEDKLLIGILDINPASKGHVLLMPKEHYPIMPLIPPETFKHLIDKTKEVDGCIKEALLCKETTIFIANGAAAGQQSSHFMLHIIPRDGGDGLEMLDVGGEKAPEGEIKEVAAKIGPHLNAVLARNLPALGLKAPSGTPQKVTKEQLLQVIESNPKLKEIILNNPEQFKQLVPKHPQLSQLFQDFDLDDILKQVIQKSKLKKPGKLSLDEALK
ncbi:MAG: HIT domain-containing protein [Nanoarchaeota archaeon]|nr:HIT domain-containing protein [Nanoarchaeota archaeon]